ncbi:MAG: cytochrome c biogenesis protein CcdA [Anaerolineae bacterium]
MELDFSAVANASLWAYFTVLAGGVVTSIGPCNMAMIPLVIAFVAGQKQISRGRSFALSAAFALGLAITFTVLGVLAALVGRIIGAGGLWYYVMAAVCILMGLQWTGVISLPLPDWGAEQREKIKHRGVIGALLLGLVSGFVASGCAMPALIAILTLVMSKGALAYGASLLLTYGIGRGVPIVLLGTFAGWTKHMSKMAAWTARIEQLSGVLMILIGLYFLWSA